MSNQKNKLQTNMILNMIPRNIDIYETCYTVIKEDAQNI